MAFATLCLDSVLCHSRLSRFSVKLPKSLALPTQKCVDTACCTLLFVLQHCNGSVCYALLVILVEQ